MTPVALVTGGARRLGEVFVRALAKQGFHVVIHANASVDRGEALANALIAKGMSAECAGFDLTDWRGVPDFMNGLVSRLGPMRLLVNSASMFEYDQPGEVDPEQFSRTIDLNLKAPVLLAQAFARPHRGKGRDSGVIVNMLDQKLWNLNPDFFSYTVAKQALHGATQLLARSFAPDVRVCGLAPGITLPSGDQTEEEFERAHTHNPMQGGSTPEDLVRALQFILDTPSFTGSTLLVDGGQHFDSRNRDVMFDPAVRKDANP